MSFLKLFLLGGGGYFYLIVVTIKKEEASTAEPPYESGQGPAPYEVMSSLLENPSKLETPSSFRVLQASLYKIYVEVKYS